MSNCATCTGEKSCDIAYTGYRVKNDKTGTEKCTTANCATCEGSASVCTACLTRYALKAD